MCKARSESYRGRRAPHGTRAWALGGVGASVRVLLAVFGPSLPRMIALSLVLPAASCKQSLVGTGRGPTATPTQMQPITGPTGSPPVVGTVTQPVGTVTHEPAPTTPKTTYFPLKSHQGLCEGAGGGVGAFGAGRSGGRTHAACDIYNAVGAPIHAVADGKVIQNAYDFYCQTDALEVNHGSYVVRYGEIRPGSAKVRAGETVKAGQVIASVGRLSCYFQPMLHFERYSGKGSGPLTTGGNRYQRRSDIENPTSFLKQILPNKPP